MSDTPPTHKRSYKFHQQLQLAAQTIAQPSQNNCASALFPVLLNPDQLAHIVTHSLRLFGVGGLDFGRDFLGAGEYPEVLQAAAGDERVGVRGIQCDHVILSVERPEEGDFERGDFVAAREFRLAFDVAPFLFHVIESAVLHPDKAVIAERIFRGSIAQIAFKGKVETCDLVPFAEVLFLIEILNGGGVPGRARAGGEERHGSRKQRAEFFLDRHRTTSSGISA